MQIAPEEFQHPLFILLSGVTMKIDMSGSSNLAERNHGEDRKSALISVPLLSRCV